MSVFFTQKRTVRVSEVSRSTPAPSRTCPCAVNLMASLSKLSSTWYSWSVSPSTRGARPSGYRQVQAFFFGQGGHRWVGAWQRHGQVEGCVVEFELLGRGFGHAQHVVEQG